MKPLRRIKKRHRNESMLFPKFSGKGRVYDSKTLWFGGKLCNVRLARVKNPSGVVKFVFGSHIPSGERTHTSHFILTIENKSLSYSYRLTTRSRLLETMFITG